MARKSMKSRVPADVWAAIEAMRKGNEGQVREIGRGGQGVVFTVDGNEDWVIKRFYAPGEKTAYGYTRYWGSDWKAKDLARDIARGLIEDVHLPRIIYARGRYVVMERLHDTVDWPIVNKLLTARDTPARELSKEWRPLRRAMRKLQLNGYVVNDIMEDNVMTRKDGTIVLNDVVA